MPTPTGASCGNELLNEKNEKEQYQYAISIYMVCFQISSFWRHWPSSVFYWHGISCTHTIKLIAVASVESIERGRLKVSLITSYLNFCMPPGLVSGQRRLTKYKLSITPGQFKFTLLILLKITFQLFKWFIRQQPPWVQAWQLTYHRYIEKNFNLKLGQAWRR